jgi:pimeloyl-ACP methyl ester carboxylesterase
MRPGLQETDSAVRRMGIGTVVAISLGVGLAAAVLLPFVPWPTVDADFATAMVLFGFALGWALLAVLSMRFTDQPQRWAVVPAVFMALSGVLLLVLQSGLVGALDWVWPPAVLVLAIWSFIQARRELRSRTRTWLLNPVLVVLLLLSAAGAYETVSRSVQPSFAMRGELVDVGPYRLHLECSGSGAPTVILEPGGGASAATLGWIAPVVARDTRVCVYDRAGKGWSDPAQTPPDGAQIATDLHTLLDRANVPGPYVLAGHSFGGLYVMRYAAQYPDEVAGLVLIDSTAPSSTPVAPQDPDAYSFVKHVSALMSTTARLGLGRLLAQGGSLPPPFQDEANVSAARAKDMASFVDEYAVAGRSVSEAGELKSLGAKPLYVLTAEVGNSPGWTEHQDAMATLSTDSLHRVVPGATHQSLMDNPTHAAAVSEAIHDVLASVRTGAALASP